MKVAFLIWFFAVFVRLAQENASCCKRSCCRRRTLDFESGQTWVLVRIWLFVGLRDLIGLAVLNDFNQPVLLRSTWHKVLRRDCFVFSARLCAFIFFRCARGIYQLFESHFAILSWLDCIWLRLSELACWTTLQLLDLPTILFCIYVAAISFILLLIWTGGTKQDWLSICTQFWADKSGDSHISLAGFSDFRSQNT